MKKYVIVDVDNTIADYSLEKICATIFNPGITDFFKKIQGAYLTPVIATAGGTGHAEEAAQDIRVEKIVAGAYGTQQLNSDRYFKDLRRLEEYHPGIVGQAVKVGNEQDVIAIDNDIPLVVVNLDFREYWDVDEVAAYVHYLHSGDSPAAQFDALLDGNDPVDARVVLPLYAPFAYRLLSMDRFPERYEVRMNCVEIAGYSTACAHIADLPGGEFQEKDRVFRLLFASKKLGDERVGLARQILYNNIREIQRGILDPEGLLELAHLLDVMDKI